MGRPAAWRSTNTARAVAVRCGTIRRLARASRPLTAITCWCMPRQQCRFKSGWLCNADQLTLMSTIGPNRATKTETNCGSSREIRGRARPPRAIDIAPQPGSQGDPHRVGLARSGVRRACLLGTDHRIRAIHRTTLRISRRSASPYYATPPAATAVQAANQPCASGEIVSGSGPSPVVGRPSTHVVYAEAERWHYEE